jgi:creatinine amidohydrolase/Fe(II)-dependent formamide hydrolase-like protein
MEQGAEMHHIAVPGTVGYSSSAYLHLVTPIPLKSAKQGARMHLIARYPPLSKEQGAEMHHVGAPGTVEL